MTNTGQLSELGVNGCIRSNAPENVGAARMRDPHLDGRTRVGQAGTFSSAIRVGFWPASR